jgi:hypothetical protein
MKNCHPERSEGPAVLPRVFTLFSLIVFALHALSQTTITITSKPLHTNFQRFGINLSGQTYYDSGQMLRNLVSRNPGFEGETWQTILHCKVATATTCIDENPWTVWPANFLANAHYEVLSGAAAGSTGTILTSSKADSKANLGVALAFTPTKTPLANGDFIVVRRDAIPGDPTAGWWATTTNGARFLPEIADRVYSGGAQSLRIEASAPNQTATLASYFDTLAGHSFVRLHGKYLLMFRAKALSPIAQLNIKLERLDSTHNTIISFLNTSRNLHPSWQSYTIPFTASEPANSVGSVALTFNIASASILLDDVWLVPGTEAADNLTEFRDEVVQTLRDLHPGILRYMDNGASFGSSLENLLTPSIARQRSGYSTQQTSAEEIPIGIPEFLRLCEAVGADPWITLPPGMSLIEAEHIIEYLDAPGNTDFGRQRRHNPWEETFHTIHLELGNEQWNSGSFPGGTINDPKAYAQRASIVFAAMRSAKGFQTGKFDLVLGSWFANSWWSQQELTNSANADTIALAPYLFANFNDAHDEEAVFGPMLAQPEQIDGRPTGLMTQQATAAAVAHKKLAVYETNLGTMSGSASQSALDSTVPSLGAALAVADHMLLMLRDLGITAQNFFALPEYRNDFTSTSGQKETMPLWGAVVDMGGVTNRRRPTFLALQMLIHALLSTEITTELSGANPTWNQPLSSNDKIQLTNAHELQTFAFAEGTHRSLILLNLSRTQSLPIHLAGPEAPTGAVTQTVLTAAHITDSNEQADLVEPHPTPYSAAETLPPHSLTVLTWSKP